MGRKKNDPPTIHYIGQSVDALVDHPVEKYGDPRNPIVTISIRGILIPNTLIDLREAINVITLQTVQQLDILNLRPTPTMLELADRSRIKPEGVLDDEIVSLDSWEYPVDLFLLQPKSTSRGHPIVLGRPWLARTHAFIGCRLGEMYLPEGNSFKQVSLYPPTKAITKLQDETWFEK